MADAIMASLLVFAIWIHPASRSRVHSTKEKNFADAPPLYHASDESKSAPRKHKI